MSGRPGVFLDRDGTLVDEQGYLGDPAGVRLFPGAARAVAALNAAGLPVVVVTNQSGVARGLFSEADVDAVHARLRELLQAAGAHLDLVLYCPHHPREGLAPYRRACDCRKPAPGLYVSGARALGLDLARSAVVGDSERDLEGGRRAGIGHLLLVATGKGRDADEALRSAGGSDHVLARDLLEAAELILARQGR